jgi:thiol:disulfide interchange protein DsbD
MPCSMHTLSSRYRLPRSWLIAFLWLISISAGSAAGIRPEDLLSPDKAFQFSAHEIGADMVRVEWRIADGYYLYRDRIHFQSDNPALHLADPVFPAPTETKSDEFFGKMAIYRGTITIDIPVIRDRTSSPENFTLKASSQGCADAGVCFPPHPQTAALQLPAVPPPFASTPSSGVKGFFSSLGDRLGLHSNRQQFLDPDQAFIYLADAAGPDRVVAHWEIANGYYLYRNKFTFTLRDAKGITLGNYGFPKGVTKSDASFGHNETHEVYYKQVEVTLPLQRNADASRTLTLETRYQGCADAGLCYPPITKTTTLTLPEGTASVNTTAGMPLITASSARPFVSEQDRLVQSLLSGNRFLTILLFFGAGLLLAFTPCMFPMIPILSSIIVGQGPEVTTRRAFHLSLAYVLAMAVTYTFAGVLAGLFGANLQVLFQSPWIIGGFSALFVVLALSMFGFYNLQLPNSWQTKISELSNKQKSGSWVGASMMGILSALIVGPCLAAPLAAALIVIGQSGNAVLGGSALFAMSLGMGVPLLAIGTSAGKWLPRAAGWMNTVKSVFGVLLLALAVWMLDRIIPPQVTLALWGVLLVVSAIYMGAFDRMQPDSGGWYRLWKGVGLVLLLYGGVLIVGAAGGGTDPLQPLQRLSLTGSPATRQESALQFMPVKGITGLQQALQTTRADGKTAMLDFYADWCVSCKEMERETFADAKVQKTLHDTVLLRADVTANDQQDQALLKRFGIFGPPSIMFFGADGEERLPYRLIGYLGPQEFVAHATQAFEAPPP